MLKDQIRTESAGILAALRRMKIRSVMLTGDRRGAARSVGEAIGIQEVRSGLKPEDKVTAIREYAQAGTPSPWWGTG